MTTATDQLEDVNLALGHLGMAMSRGLDATKMMNISGSPCFTVTELLGGLVYTHPSEKYEFVNGDDDIPNISGKIQNVPNHQPVYCNLK